MRRCLSPFGYSPAAAPPTLCGYARCCHADAGSSSMRMAAIPAAPARTQSAAFSAVTPPSAKTGTGPATRQACSSSASPVPGRTCAGCPRRRTHFVFAHYFLKHRRKQNAVRRLRTRRLNLLQRMTRNADDWRLRTPRRGENACAPPPASAPRSRGQMNTVRSRCQRHIRAAIVPAAAALANHVPSPRRVVPR